jgi:hypothetical protein
VGELVGKYPLERRRCEDDIKINLTDRGDGSASELSTDVLNLQILLPEI